MKYFKFLILFITMGLLQACPTSDDEILAGKLLIKNSSNEPFYYYEDFSINILNTTDINFNRLKAQQLIVDNAKEINIYHYHFEKNESLYIFLFKESTINDHSLEEIQEQNLYDKRYCFTLDELNAMNWELVYNGN